MQIPKPKVQYYDPNNLWNAMSSDIQHKLPLRNVQWVDSFQKQRHFVTSIDIEFIPWYESYNTNPATRTSSIINTPLVNMMFVPHEDIETFKNQQLKLIQEWVDKVSQRESQQWMIVLVSTSKPVAKPSTSMRRTHTRSSSYFSSRVSVLDRLRAAYSTEGFDRCVHLDYLRFGTPDAECWNAFITCLKNCVVCALDFRFTQLDEQIKSMPVAPSSDPSMYILYFTQLIRQACSYYDVSLYNEALEHFEGILAFLMDNVHELLNTNQPFSKLFGEGTDAIQMDKLLDYLPSKHPLFDNFHELLASDNLTLFNFILYLYTQIIKLQIQLNALQTVHLSLKNLFRVLEQCFKDVEKAPLYYRCWKFRIIQEFLQLMQPKVDADKENSLQLSSYAYMCIMLREELLFLAVGVGAIPSESLLAELYITPSTDVTANGTEKDYLLSVLPTLETDKSSLGYFADLTKNALNVLERKQHSHLSQRMMSDLAICLFELKNYDSVIPLLPFLLRASAFSNPDVDFKKINLCLDVFEQTERYDDAIDLLLDILCSEGYNERSELSSKYIAALHQFVTLDIDKTISADKFFTIEYSNRVELTNSGHLLEVKLKRLTDIFQTSIESASCDFVSTDQDSKRLNLQYLSTNSELPSTGISSLTFGTKNIIPGTYSIEKIEFKLKDNNLRFVQSFTSSEQNIYVPKPSRFSEHPYILNDRLYTCFVNRKLCFPVALELPDSLCDVSLSFPDFSKFKDWSLQDIFLYTVEEGTASIEVQEDKILITKKAESRQKIQICIPHTDEISKLQELELRIAYSIEKESTLVMIANYHISEDDIFKVDVGTLPTGGAGECAIMMKLEPKLPVYLHSWTVCENGEEKEPNVVNSAVLNSFNLATAIDVSSLASFDTLFLHFDYTFLEDYILAYLCESLRSFLPNSDSEFYLPLLKELTSENLKHPNSAWKKSFFELQKTKPSGRMISIFSKEELSIFDEKLKEIPQLISFQDIHLRLLGSQHKGTVDDSSSPICLSRTAPLRPFTRLPGDVIDCHWQSITSDNHVGARPFKTTVGQPTDIELVIQRTTHKESASSTEQLQLQYKCTADSSTLAIGGPIIGTVIFHPGQNATRIRFTLTPTATGIFTLPTIHMANANDDDILAISNPDYLIVEGLLNSAELL
ncbi:TRAPP complex subunit Trs130 [Schizosaccharomyces japonicus yFS275]|uniref:TRAPP complex subunit Trs130 n=1 Tax=Schizosaccharomyces japonicus (strain yFS275 / FY16936) TaxID=402676 RepID=B6K128_SCHJY|nr:TRAPP complex subunit Trs130 [Schizosaccharomyces japonicus yFS275]EEB07649.2 TRAPP complex subunit Trs130 [Schizosaccharomyces japonicus yFS275]